MVYYILLVEKRVFGTDDCQMHCEVCGDGEVVSNLLTDFVDYITYTPIII